MAVSWGRVKFFLDAWLLADGSWSAIFLFGVTADVRGKPEPRSKLQRRQAAISVLAPVMPETSSTRACPLCRQPAAVEGNPYRPFCSERCRLIDLANWASERYRIPGESVEEPTSPGGDDDVEGEE